MRSIFGIACQRYFQIRAEDKRNELFRRWKQAKLSRNQLILPEIWGEFSHTAEEPDHWWLKSFRLSLPFLKIINEPDTTKAWRVTVPTAPDTAESYVLLIRKLSEIIFFSGFRHRFFKQYSESDRNQISWGRRRSRSHRRILTLSTLGVLSIFLKHVLTFLNFIDLRLLHTSLEIGSYTG